MYINDLRCTGLYSFSEEVCLTPSNRSLIVGPNNSGKSNLFRLIKILIETFSKRRRLEDSELYNDVHDATLQAKLSLSPEETELIVCFLSFYPDRNSNDTSIFFEYRNHDFLKNILNELTIKLTWRREIEGYGSQPYVEIEFTKIGLKLFGLLYSGFRVYHMFPQKDENYVYVMKPELCDFLNTLHANQDNKLAVENFFASQIKGQSGLSSIRVNRNIALSDRAQNILRTLFSYVGVSIEIRQELSFHDIIGTILEKNIHYISDSRIFNPKSILDYAELLKRDIHSSNTHEDLNFNTILDSQAYQKSLEFSTELQIDGSNLSSFLFSLKNSQKYTDRLRFEKIQKQFEQIFVNSKLGFDVIVNYDVGKRSKVWGGRDQFNPKMPNLVIIDRVLNRQFPLSQVGSGLTEVIHLLTVAHGVQNNVILLDEPSVRLHPALMKTVLRDLQDFTLHNQFLIITHSPELANLEIFDGNASLFYVRRTLGMTKVKTLEGEVKTWFDSSRDKLKHQIDARMFFGRSVILTEGDSDKNLLSGITDFFESNNELDLFANDVIIISVNGKKNFEKYRKLLDVFEIPYKILADADAKNLFETSGIITKSTIQTDNSVIIIEQGTLEQLMQEIDPHAYSKASQNNGSSKPAIAFEFAKNVTANNPQNLQSLKQLLLHAIEIAKN